MIYSIFLDLTPPTTSAAILVSNWWLGQPEDWLFARRWTGWSKFMIRRLPYRYPTHAFPSAPGMLQFQVTQMIPSYQRIIRLKILESMTTILKMVWLGVTTAKNVSCPTPVTARGNMRGTSVSTPCAHHSWKRSCPTLR